MKINILFYSNAQTYVIFYSNISIGKYRNFNANA